MNFSKYLLLLVFILPISGQANVDNDRLIVWNNLESAQLQHREIPKPIFIEFTAKWCGWCKKMDETTFADDKVISLLNETFYAVKVDFDSPEPMEFQGKKYTGKELAKYFGINGLPTMIYLPMDQKSSKTIVGYKTAKQLVKELNRLNKP